MLAAALLALLATAPAGTAALDSCREALVRIGDVRYEFAGPAANWPHDCCVYGEYDYGYRYTYTYRFTTRGDSTWYEVDPVVSAQDHLRHVIDITQGPAPASMSRTARQLHALDHVAISTNERRALLFRYLVSHMGALQLAGLRTEPRDSLVHEAIGREVGRYGDALSHLAQVEYRRLDRETRFGARPLRHRRRFFASLYSERDMILGAFPYLRDVHDLLATPRYRNALRYDCP